MKCRPDCGACCTAPSITSPLPGMPQGKPAGVTCVNLDLETRKCRIWGSDSYPEVCRRFAADPAVCGDNRQQALTLLQRLEIETSVN
jgi:Fe-S-cluster containining protein